MMNPLREVVEKLGRTAMDRPSPFRDEAESLLAGFRAGRQSLEANVRAGEMTPKVARVEASRLASGLAIALKERASDFSVSPRAFLDRLVETSERRATAAEHAPLDVLQRETNRLLRSVLVEQQIQVRRDEFEGRAFTRPAAGGRPAPTLDGLIGFHQVATLGGDEAGAEWARRHLETMRGLVANDADQRRIDLATDRPDRVNPRLVSAYAESIEETGPEERERFVAEAVASKDANACLAAFLLARSAPEGSRLRWVRMVLDGVNDFPDIAVTTLRSIEAEARSAERQAAIGQAEFVSAQAESEARLSGLEAPTDAELARRDAVAARPIARPGEAIGLTLARRGAFEGESIPDDVETPDLT